MKKTRIFITAIIFMLIISICTISKAGMEIKSGTSDYVYVNISESFDICYNLRDGTSTLGTCDLDPHMATSLDWGAVAYLAKSRYGANSSSVSNNTTGNQSGIMNMSGWTQTATMMEERNKTSNNAKNFRYRLEEIVGDNNLKKYVDLIPASVTSENTKGRAIAETANWYGASYEIGANTDYPICIRNSLFGLRYGDGNSYGGSANGGASSSVTFRPVIWN